MLFDIMRRIRYWANHGISTYPTLDFDKLSRNSFNYNQYNYHTTST